MSAISNRINNHRESNEVKDTDSRILDYQRHLTQNIERLRNNKQITKEEYRELMTEVSTLVREHTRQLREDSNDRYGSSS